jgi:uncharacterized cupin superfamily protein
VRRECRCSASSSVGHFLHTIASSPPFISWQPEAHFAGTTNAAETASANSGTKRLLLGMFSKTRAAYPQTYPQIASSIAFASHDQF